MKLSDREILEAIRAGKDKVPLEYLYKTLFPKVRRTLSKKSADEDAVKDIFQEAVVIFYDKVITGEFDANYAIGAYIMTIAKNKWTNVFKREVRSRGISYDIEIQLVNDSTYDLVFDKERANLVAEIFQDLGEVCSKLLNLVIYGGLAMKDVATEMGFTNENVAKTKHYKCKKRLIDRLRDNEAFKRLLLGE